MPSIWEDVLDGQWGCAILPGTAHTLCYQERTGASATTPAVADGDPVGTIHDLISGLYVTMGSDAARPTFRASGGVSWLEFDGSSDVLVAAPGTYTGTVIYGIALVRDTSGMIVSVTKNSEEDWNNNGRAVLMGRAGGSLQLYRNGILRDVEYPGAGVEFVVEAQSGSTLSLIGIPGGALSSSAHSDAGAFDANRIGFISRGNGSVDASGRLYGALVVGAAPTSGERADLAAAALALLEPSADGAASGGVVTVAASLIAGSASGVRAPIAEGQILAAVASLVAGSATGIRAPVVAGQVLSAGVSLVAGNAGGSIAPMVPGQIVTAVASLLSGAASGESAAVAEGQILAAAASLVAGSATGIRAPVVAGQTVIAAALLLSGVASGGGVPVESRREQVLRALLAALGAARPSGAVLLRNAILPERIPPGGLMILRDGDPGEPAFLFSPPRYYYEHRAEVDVLVDAATPAERDAVFDLVARSIAQALAQDRTLGGLVDYALGEAPAPLELPIEGAEGLKAASIGVILPYDTSDPLA